MNPSTVSTPCPRSSANCRNGGSAFRGVSGVTLLMLVSMVLATSPAVGGGQAAMAVGEQVRIAESRLPRSGQQTLTESLEVRKNKANHETRPGACVVLVRDACGAHHGGLTVLAVENRERPRVGSLVRDALLSLPPPVLA